MKNDIDPSACGVCGEKRWRVCHEGPIRHGTFGNHVMARVFECEECGVGFLPTSVGLTPDYYRGTSYRQMVGEGSDPESYFQLHDAEQLDRYPLLRRTALRGRAIAEIGSAAGSFLDGVSGLASTTVAVEPAAAYHDSLKQRGHHVFSSVADALAQWTGRIHVAVCFSVIEHVSEPVVFLRELRALLAPGGVVLLSTPNSGDVLLAAGCEAYRQFFYRSVHTYYFDEPSLRRAALRAGFSGFEPHFVHRFNFSNFVTWLMRGTPSGNAGAALLRSGFDRTWQAEVEESGRADYLYAWLTT